MVGLRVEMIPTFSKASFYFVPVSATGKVCSLAFWSSQAEEEKNLAVGNLLPKQSFHKLRHFVFEFHFGTYMYSTMGKKIPVTTIFSL